MEEPFTPGETDKLLFLLNDLLKRAEDDKEKAEAKVRDLEQRLKRANHDLDLVDRLSKL